MPGKVQDETPMSYEAARRHRLEENKRRMEELGLSDLSKGLAQQSGSGTKLSSSRQVKPRALKESMFIEPRRSSRASKNPAPNYKENTFDLPFTRRSYARPSLARKYASDESRMQAAEKAEELEKELGSQNPSFVKMMLQSHVSGGFWLGLPRVFCKSHLPKDDKMIVLEDEEGQEWETVYLASKNGLSGGWRGFSLDHSLEDGDALIFELTHATRFKIHIVRAAGEYEESKDGEEKLEATEGSNAVDVKGNKRKQKSSTSDDGMKKKKAEIDEAKEELSKDKSGKGKNGTQKQKQKQKQNQKPLMGMLKSRKSVASADLKKDSMACPTTAGIAVF